MIPAYAAVGLVAYLAFHVAFFLYDAWLTNLGKDNAAIRNIAPYCIDGCPTYYLQAAPTFKAVIKNLLLIALFAVQHSGMARASFKRQWLRYIPAQLERSVYVMAASLSLIILAAFWEPLPYVWFEFPSFLGTLMTGVHYLGVAIIIASTFMIDHLELFGLAQSFSDTAPISPSRPRTAASHAQSTANTASSDTGNVENVRGKAATTTMCLSRRGFYNYIRHPIIAGSLLMLWASPCYSTGRLLLNIMFTAYSLSAVHFLEEPDLRRQFGEEYKAYEDTVPGYIPNLANIGGTTTRRTTIPKKMESSSNPAHGGVEAVNLKG